MFSTLLRRLFPPKPQPLPELDERRALAALLVRVAKTDGTYAVEEIRRIDRILAKTFDMNPVDAARLRAQSERLEHDAPDGTAFAEKIAQAVEQETREAVLAAMWQVALADGVERPAEDNLMARTAERLDLDEAALARARAAATGQTVVPRMKRSKE